MKRSIVFAINSCFRRKAVSATVFALIMLGWITRASADQIEFLSGAKAEGSVKKIDKEAKTVEFELQVGGRALTRTYRYDQIHAVTLGEKRYVLNPTGAGKSTPASGGPAGDPNANSNAPDSRRSRSQIDALIAQAGASPPEWFESTPLDYPKSLDLSFPKKPEGEWNNQKNVGQYVWDIINPNANRWREGVRLLHHLLSVNQDNPEVQTRVMRDLGDMYFRLFQDYARAAFWWKKAGVKVGEPQSIYLAECYWRLGNKQMAEALLNQRTLFLSMIKLWGDMGETRKATDLAEEYVRVGGPPHDAYLLAGDACRTAGQLDQAIRYYQKTVDTPTPDNLKDRVERTQKRAQANLEAIRLFEQSDPKQVADGAYRAESLGYEAPVEVEVTVRSGRIETVEVTRHREKQYYSALRDMPQQIIAKQGVKGVDTTSKATITAEAIVNATAKALAQGAAK